MGRASSFRSRSPRWELLLGCICSQNLWSASSRKTFAKNTKNYIVTTCPRYLYVSYINSTRRWRRAVAKLAQDTSLFCKARECLNYVVLKNGTVRGIRRTAIVGICQVRPEYYRPACEEALPFPSHTLREGESTIFSSIPKSYIMTNDITRTKLSIYSFVPSSIQWPNADSRSAIWIGGISLVLIHDEVKLIFLTQYLLRVV